MVSPEKYSSKTSLLVLTKSKLSPVILMVCPFVITVYLYSPRLASGVLRLCIRARDALADDGRALSSLADELMLELEPVRGPPAPELPSRTGEAFLLIVSSISCLAWLILSSLAPVICTNLSLAPGLTEKVKFVLFHI